MKGPTTHNRYFAVNVSPGILALEYNADVELVTCQQTRPLKDPAEKVVQDIRRATRKHYSAEEKIRIVLEGLRGEDSIAEFDETLEELMRPSRS